MYTILLIIDGHSVLPDFSVMTVVLISGNKAVKTVVNVKTTRITSKQPCFSVT